MAVNNSLDKGEPNARAFKFLCAMEPLKDLKQFV
jgi:hypothetical protein